MTLGAGDRVGDYEIEAELGEGGMARVYRARHVMLDTHHALKVLDPELRANAQARQRFLDEARIQAKHLEHPGIVKVTNIVATPDHAALVMELVDGTSLEAEVGTLASRPDEIRRIMRAVLDAVGYAHGKGIIHRDLKPANVLLAGAARTPKVSDFGIAKLAESSGTKKSTVAGARMGTLAYMSPEQVRQAKDVTARSDVFSLGAMLYELATGHLPFEAENDFDLMRKIVDGDHVPPRTRNAKLDPAIAAAIERALDPDPAKRFASCAEMAAALGGETAVTPITKEPSPPPAPAPPPVRPRMGLWIVLALGACAATGAAVYLATRGPGAATPADASVVATMTAPPPDAASPPAIDASAVAIDAAEAVTAGGDPAPARRAAWIANLRATDKWSTGSPALRAKLTDATPIPRLTLGLAAGAGTMSCGVELGDDGNPQALTACRGEAVDPKCKPRAVSYGRVALTCALKGDRISCAFRISGPTVCTDDEWAMLDTPYELWRPAIPEDTGPIAVPTTSADPATVRAAAWKKNVKGFDVDWRVYMLGVRVVDDKPTLAFRIFNEQGTARCVLELGADGHPAALTGCTGLFYDADSVENRFTWCKDGRRYAEARVKVGACTPSTVKKQAIVQCPFTLHRPDCDKSGTWNIEPFRYALWRPRIPED